jgi:hypothetical protein
VEHLPLHLDYLLAGVRFVPVPVQVFSHCPELDKEITRDILRLDLAPLLSPQPQQSRLVLSHDDPGIRAANEGATITLLPNFRRRSYIAFSVAGPNTKSRKP